MALFQVSFSISGDQVDPLEELLLELDEGHWNIYLDNDSQQGTASGVYETEIEAREDWSRIGPHLEKQLEGLNPQFESLSDSDWKDSYKAHFQPWSFDRLHWVPVWERESYPLPDGDAVVWLDPGMAFGTGNHETTRLCIEALLEFLKMRSETGQLTDGLTCCDAGCGSGILAISARKMGFSPVVGFDNDPDAVRISHENADMNELVGKVDFWEGDLETGFKEERYHLVFANILASVLIKHPDALLASVKPAGRLILSGILTKEVDEVHSTFRDKLNRMGETGTFMRHQLGEWSSLVMDLD